MHRPANAIVNLKLRLDERLRRKLEAAAEKNDRSMNAEIIHRLERSFSEPELARLMTQTIIQRMMPIESFVSQAAEKLGFRLPPIRGEGPPSSVRSGSSKMPSIKGQKS